MGELIDLNSQIAEPRIDGAIARDSEITAAISSHASASDPHPIYLTQSEADARYRQIAANNFFTPAALPAGNVAGNSIALGWNSVSGGLGIAELCNYSGLGGGDAFNFFRLPGNPTTPPTVSNRVARIDITGAYVQTSDRRVKTRIEASPGLSIVLQLLPRKYRHYEVAAEGFDKKNKEILRGTSFKEKMGFVAQEVKKILPEAVSETESEDELYGIDYSCIFACVVRAVQEQQEQIASLQNRVSELERIA